MNEKVYKKGEAYTSLDELVEDVKKGRWVWRRFSPQPPAVLDYMSLGTAYRSLDSRILFKAIKNDEEVTVGKR